MAAYFSILALWLVLWIVFYGWGTLACTVARCDREDADALIVNPWIGMAGVLGLLQIWNFFAPMGAWACLAVAALGMLAAALFGLRGLSKIPVAVRQYPLSATFALLFVLWLANRSLNTQEYTDHGLYYLNSIRWASDFPVVPGLANLHNRLAFNNSNFLLHAMLEPLTGRGYSSHVLNGLMAAMSVPIIVLGIRSAFGRSANDRQIGWFALALLMLVLTSALDRRISSATPDFPAALFITIAAWRLLVLGAFQAESRDRLLRWNLLTIAMLATAAVTLKTMVIFFAGLAGIALAACLYRVASERRRSRLPATVKSLSFMVPWCVLLFGPWALRGYVLSGYPLFPSTVAGVPVDWAYDVDEAAQLRHDIYAWARTTHLNIEGGYEPGWGWVPEWLVQAVLLRAPVEVVAPAAISLACVAWLAWCALRLRSGRLEEDSWTEDDRSQMAWFAASLLVGAYMGAILMWFLTAPSPRMGSFAWWGIAATLVGMVSRTAAGEWMVRRRRLVLAGLAVLVLLPMLDEAVRVELRYRKNPNLPEFGAHFYHYFPFVLPQADEGFPPLPEGDLVQRRTNSGLLVYLAAPHADGKPGLLWDSPLPAARFFKTNLTLRYAGQMERGFEIVPPDKNSSNQAR